MKMLSPCFIMRTATFFFTAILLLTFTLCAHAEEKKSGWTAIAKFTVGVVTAFAVHEGAHMVAGAATGTDMDWEAGNYNQPFTFEERADNDTAGFIISSAGLAAQVVGAEIILHTDRIDKNDPFVRGMMAWNIINPISYALDYWFIRRTNYERDNSYQGDLQGVEYYSDEGTANAFAAGVTAMALWQGYRFVQTQTWAPDWARTHTDNLQFAPLPDYGFRLTYEIDF